VPSQQIAWLPDRAQVPLGQQRVKFGQRSPEQGIGVVVVVEVGVGGGGGGGMVGRVRASRASTEASIAAPVTTAPPNPSIPFRIDRRDTPWATDRHSESNRRSSTSYPTLSHIASLTSGRLIRVVASCC